MQADYFCLPDDTQIDSSSNASNQKIKLMEKKVTIHDSEQSLQTISPIFNSEGTGTRCINQKAPLMSEQNQLYRDAWCLSVTCAQGENGKSISPTDSAQSTMARGADTDSDLARPPDGNHPSSRHAIPGMLLQSATRRRTACHVVAHQGSRDSVCNGTTVCISFA
jgi:hypothetical protein